MQPWITVLLVLAKALGILLLTVLGLLLLILLILWAVPASVWLSYQDDAFAVQVGALGKKFALWPRPPKKTKQPKKPKPAKKAKKAKKAEPAKQPKAAKSAPQAARQTQKAGPAEQKAQKQKPPAAENPSGGGVRFTDGAPAHIGEAPPKPQPPAEEEPQAKLTFDQIVTAVRGAGTFGKRVLAALRVTEIRLYLPITGGDAAECALNYGKAQAWLHSGLAVLNRAIWLEFEECRLEADFLEKGDKKPHFSCKISARLLIIGIAAFRFGWLLWKQDILTVLLRQFAGKDQ